MSVSGVTSFELSALQIIERAFARLGVAQEGEALTPRMWQDGLAELNLLITEWNAHPRLWIAAEEELTMVADTPSYVITPTALRITQARYHNINSGLDTPMTMFSRQEYYDQPTKDTSPSIPVNFYYDPQVSSGTLFLWPCPSASTATQYTIKYDYIRLMSIMTATNDTLDLPFQWQQPIIWNLASNLETQYPVNDPRLAAKVDGMAAKSYQSLLEWDNEPASLYMQPDYMSQAQP